MGGLQVGRLQPATRCRAHRRRGRRGVFLRGVRKLARDLPNPVNIFDENCFIRWYEQRRGPNGKRLAKSHRGARLGIDDRAELFHGHFEWGDHRRIGRVRRPNSRPTGQCLAIRI